VISSGGSVRFWGFQHSRRLPSPVVPELPAGGTKESGAAMS